MVGAPEPALRDYIDALIDSTRWDDFVPRDGDIVVSTPPKSGTTWTQAILALLISGDPLVDANTSLKSPWIDIKGRDITEVMARLAAQDHRRQVKTHTPLDGIPYWAELRYITVYRHPIDVHFSRRKHFANTRSPEETHLYPDDPSDSFRLFLAKDNPDGASLQTIIHHYRCALERSPCENLMRLHYAAMQRDLAGTVARIASHTGISRPPGVMERLVQAATFQNMKANPQRFAPAAGNGHWRDDAGFFDSATSNKWEGRLTAKDLAAYDAVMAQLLTPTERSWLEWGSKDPASPA